ncbi:hypothetical protein [Ructibacterium gallinarum]|uniref:Uncharacterized protein n=1 Tax=Ructibacterium gallinarum TaxID=2779355 RepID=A0A9D5M1E7_9FIRM|nr:hypothetical protein [Ructibacterium gallinarum]MBE5040852.1 hypothetical protein [Ructibacterium gallinarum]
MGTNKKMFSDGGTYISKIAIARLTIKKHIQIIIGGFFTAVFLFGIISGVTGYNENLRDNLITNVVMIVPSALLLLNGIKNGRMAARAYRYNSIFMCDVDGTVTINELANQSGKPPFKVISELEKLFEKGVFCECTLQKQGSPCVILSGREGSKTGFVNIVCEKCNGTTRIRAGSSGKCEYCGNAISSRNSG